MKTDQSARERLPLVSIGIPTFNRLQQLSRKLDQVCNQTYSNLEIIVSDNASPIQGIRDMLLERANTDKRLKLFFQPRNIGAIENFQFVLNQAQGPYFAWASDDDGWHSRYIECCLQAMQQAPDVGVTFTNFEARYTDGKRAEIYPAFLPYLKEYALKSKVERLYAYILQHEGFGKANVIYGLYDMRQLRRMGGLRIWGHGTWGADMLFVCGMLAQANFAVSERLEYYAECRYPATGEEASFKRSRIRNLLSALKEHMGYLTGYFRIVNAADGVSTGEKIRLYGAIIQRIRFWLMHDLNHF